MEIKVKAASLKVILAHPFYDAIPSNILDYQRSSADPSVVDGG